MAARAQVDTTQYIVADRQNSPAQMNKPYLIMISCDGFRYDYASLHHAKNITELGQRAVHMSSMIPSYPSLTFPNHYSIVTGLYPSHHGLVDNQYYDRERKDFYSVGNRAAVEDGKRYGGTPLWVLAEKQQMLSASFYCVGSEADVQGVRPTYYYRYGEAIDIPRRVQIVKEWLSLPAEKRPHLITFYLPQVDHAGHLFGPAALQTDSAVQLVDNAIGQLTEMAKGTGLDINFILVSDHGMTALDQDNPLQLPPSVDTSRFIIPHGSQLIMLYAKDAKDIRPTYKQLKAEATDFDVYLKNKMPRYLHYRKKDDRYNRIGDILIIPHWPKAFAWPGYRLHAGAHGFDPYLVKDMHAIFYAWGPAFKSALELPSYPNVDIYPIVTRLLGLKIEGKIDGNKKLAEAVLK